MPTHHHPHATPARLSPRHERWLAGMGLALLASGALWLVFHQFRAVQGEFGTSPHPLEAWWLRVHGAAAMGFLVVLGTVLQAHVGRAWGAGRNRRTGAAVLGTCAALIVTGYGLYYSGSEALRPWISALHWGIGLLALPAVLLHVLNGRRTARRPRAPGAAPGGAARPGGPHGGTAR